MQITYEQVGKHVIAEHQTTLVCGVGLNTDEALAHLEERMAVYTVDSKKPFFEARRAISNQVMKELIFSTHLRENPLALAMGRKAGSCF